VGILLERKVGDYTGLGTLIYRGGRRDDSLFVLVYRRDSDGGNVYDVNLLKTPERVKREGHIMAYYGRDLDTALRIALDVLRGKEADYYPCIV